MPPSFLSGLFFKKREKSASKSSRLTDPRAASPALRHIYSIEELPRARIIFIRILLIVLPFVVPDIFRDNR